MDRFLQPGVWASRRPTPAAPFQHGSASLVRPHRRELVAQSSQLATPAPIDDSVDLSIQNVTYENGVFSITGRLCTPIVPPDVAYGVLTDYEALPSIFHNVDEAAVHHTPEGDKVISQRCSWRFLVFRGSFVTELTVEECASQRQLQFELRQSAFMRKFVGAWDVRPTAAGGCEIWHSMAVAPALAPPKRIGEITKKIFVSQVEGILGDLAVELHRRSVDLDT